ncbi:MAG: UbiA family prenyltransferase [bacterium]|nr:UbiA family prenyltransferase [bacterium]
MSALADSALTPDSPYPRRLRAYLAQRFPLLGHGVLIVSYYSSNQFLAHVLTRPGESMHYSLRSLAGAVTLFCLFFLLRVCDEHKDFADDSKHYPDRVLQRGIITLRDLKMLGAVAVAVAVGSSALCGWAPVVALLIVLAFSGLMLKEFFVSAWLKRHFLLYATTHMLIMPLYALMIFSFATGRYPWQAPAWFWVYAFVGFFVTFNWEVSRKIRAPEEEIEGVASYSKIFGVYGAAYAVLMIRVIDTGMVALVGHHLGLSRLFYGALVALFVVCLVGFLHFRFHTNPRTAKRMETYAGMYIIAFDLILAVEIARRYGLELPL